MVNNCPTLHFFNNEEDQGLLLNIVSPILQNSKNVTYSKLYNQIVKALKDLHEISFGADTFMSQEWDAYKQSIDSMKSILIDLSKSLLKDVDQKYINSFINTINSNFDQDAGLVSDESEPVEQPSEHTIEGINAEEEPQESLENALTLVYGTSNGARTTREEEFHSDIVKAIIIDVDKDLIISDNESLNESIANYKNKQYANIVRYLKFNNPEYNFSEQMYDDNGDLDPDYYEVINKFNKLISVDKFSDTINSEWFNFTETDQKSLLLEAVNSYINLVYFDDLLKKDVGKVVGVVNPDFENKQLSVYENKYAFGKIDEHKVKHWGVNDVRDALGNISKFSKLLISTIKVYSAEDGKFQHKYASLQTFSNAITHLFGAAPFLEGTNYNNLKRAIDKFHSNPNQYAVELLKELSELKDITILLSGSDFTRFDYNILTSVYKQIYDKSNKKSILSVETRARKKKFKIGRYSIIESINGVMDRTMEASYLQTVFDTEDKVYVTDKKSKYNSRRESYNTINSINYKNINRLSERRAALVKEYKINQTLNTTVEFNLGRLNPSSKDDKTEIIFKAIFKDGVLENKGYSLTSNNENLIKLFNKVFSPSSSEIDLSSAETILKILSGKGLNQKEQLFRNVLLFIDSFLDLQMLSENGLATLNVFKSIYKNDKSYINDILQYAIKSAVITNYYNDFNKESTGNSPKYKIYEFEKFMHDKYFGAEDASNYFKNNYGLLHLKTIWTEAAWVDNWNDAKAILSADASKSTTKDSKGNSLGNYRTSFLGGNLRYYLDKFSGKKNSAISPLLFSENDLIRDVVIDTDAKTRRGTVKSVRDMKSGELYYAHIIHDFFGTYLQKYDHKHPLGRCMVVLPTTMSDKVTPINYAVDASRTVKVNEGEKNVSLAHASTNQLIDLMLNTVGEAYKTAYSNIINLYNKLFSNIAEAINLGIIDLNDEIYNLILGIVTIDPNTNQYILNLNEDTLLNWLNNHTLKELLFLVNRNNKLFPNSRVEIKLEVHYRKLKNGKLSLNELYYHFSKILYNDKAALIERLNLEKVSFVEELIETNVNFYTHYASDSFENKKHPVQRIIESDLFDKETQDYIQKEWVSKGKLILAKTRSGKEIKNINDLKGLTDVVLNPILEKYFYTDILISNNLRFPLTGTEAAHANKSKINIASELSKKGITSPELIKELNIYDINEKGEEVVTQDLIKLAKCTDTRVRSVYKDIIRKIESTALGTLYKRNVIIPATLQYEQMGVLNGILPLVKAAVMEDIQASIYNFRGDGMGPNPKTEDAHDGSALLDPFTCILENLALQDLEVGVDKKPIWHSYDAETMSDVLVKFAVFTMTNERMRESLKGTAGLYKMFKKMTDIKWFNPDGTCNFSKANKIPENFNLLNTIGFKQHKRTLNFLEDILNNEQLFYVLGDEHWEITGFGYDENGYYTLERKVLINGDTINDNGDIKYYHKFDELSNHYKYTKDQLSAEGAAKGDINSLFQLFNVFGGIYSETLINGKLEGSLKSAHVVVNFMNNVSIRLNDSKSDLLDLSVYYQPLKEMMISYVINQSAIKVGAANINPESSWSDDTELSYMTLDSDGLGIQMDADHDIDEAEMTEFTQVISALSAGGRLYDVANEVYHLLGELAILSSSLEVDAVHAFIEKVYSKKEGTSEESYKRDCELLKSYMYDIIGRTLINNYKPNNEKFDLAGPIINKIKQTFNIFDDHTLAPLKLAFSDPNLFSTTVSTFMSNLNKKSIKRQYPGSGSVMAPGYNIIQIYKINGIPYQFDDLVERAWKLNKSKGKQFFDLYNSSQDLTSYNINLVSTYLNNLQAEEYKNNSVLTLDKFIPTDIVDVIKVNEDGTFTKIGELNFEEVDFYYKCKFLKGFLNKYLGISNDTQIQFASNLTSPRNLAPSRITWEQDGKQTNIFDTEEVANSFGYSTLKWEGQFNTLNIDTKVYSLTLSDDPRNDEYGIKNNLKRRVLHIRLKGKEDIGEFMLVADTPIHKSSEEKEFTGSYSVHFKTRSREDNGDSSLRISTPEERQLLYDALYEAIPVGAEVSTWGSLTEDGIKAMDKFGKRFTKFGVRSVTRKIDGSSIEIGVYRKNVQDRKAILKVFDDLNEGLYHGKEIKNFSNEPAELIMSDLYASKRGIKESLPTILEKGPNAFKVWSLPKIGLTSYDFIFTSNNNKNLFFTFGKVKSPNLEPTKIKWRYKPVKNKKTGEIEVFHTNKEGERQFLVGKYVKTSLTYEEHKDGTITFLNDDGNISNDPNLRIGVDGVVYKYYEYITGYTVFEKGSNGKLNSYKIYQINKKNVHDALTPRAGETEVRGMDVNNAISSMLATIYSNNSFNGIRLNSKILTKNAMQLEPVLDNMSTIMPIRESQLIKDTHEYLKDVHSRKDIYVDLNAIKVNDKPYNKFILNYYNEANNALYTSFLKSRYYTSARIPAQTLQSFMLMQLVGFTKSSKNICYVSHWQTYLQGSDYDIDKAYIMGLSLDDNGMYIGWSNLFDYSSLETLKASEHLPLPKNVKYAINSEVGIDISLYAAKILDAFNNSLKILAYAELLKFLDKQPTVKDNGDQYIYIKFNESVDRNIAEEIALELNRHTKTKLSGDKLESAMKNSVSSRILRIIQNPRNMDLAYTSIDGEMARIRKASSNSSRNSKISSMTMLNPLTKYLMLVVNMTGKGGIGIAANGEKVFFNLTNYWNEGIRSNDDEWKRNLRFNNTFDRIYERSTGQFSRKIVKVLPNVNFEGYEDLKDYFKGVLEIDAELRKQFGITNTDVILKNNKWQAYNKALKEALKPYQDSDLYVDLNISALLSAATDNAKELILYNINAGTNLAKCHIHLIILGFNLDDIVAFMTNPAVSLVDELSNANMFDEYLPELKIPNVIKMLEGDFPLNSFFNGDYLKYNKNQEHNPDFSSGGKMNPQKQVFGALYKLRLLFEEFGKKEIEEGKLPMECNYASIRKNLDQDSYRVLINTYGEKYVRVIEKHTDKNNEITFDVLVPNKYDKLNSLIKTYFNARLRNDLNNEQTLNSFLESSELTKFNRMNNNVNALSEFMDNIIYKIKNSGNLDEFYKDLDEFKKLYEYSDETSTLGSKFLKLNQGLPTDESGMINLMLQFLRAFDDRFSKTKEHKLFEYFKDKSGNVTGFTIHSDVYSESEVLNMIDEAIKNKIVSLEGDNLFDIEKWINDVDGSYRKATANFYNLIKGTWNVFDIVERTPHFEAIFRLLRMSFLMKTNLIRKSHMMWLVAKGIYKGEEYIDPVELDKLQSAMDDQLIIMWLAEKNITFPVFKNEKYFSEFFEEETATALSTIIVSDEYNRATFKLRFENLIEQLKEGRYKDVDENGEEIIKELPELIDNAFIKNLVSDADSNGAIYYKLNIDMQKIAATLFNSKNYLKCLDGFLELRSYTFNGRPLTDWFMLYNIIVNKNMWGSNRLTSLFGPFINILDFKEDSLIKLYFEDNGQADYNHIAASQTLEDLKEKGLNISDILWKIAPIITEDLEASCKAKIVKEFDENGVLIVKRKIQGVYYKTDLFHNLPAINSYWDSLVRISNYLNYSSIQTPFNNRQVSVVNMLLDAILIKNENMTKEDKEALAVSKLRKALYNLTTNGVLTIRMENC